MQAPPQEPVGYVLYELYSYYTTQHMIIHVRYSKVLVLYNVLVYKIKGMAYLDQFSY